MHLGRERKITFHSQACLLVEPNCTGSQETVTGRDAHTNAQEENLNLSHSKCDSVKKERPKKHNKRDQRRCLQQRCCSDCSPICLICELDDKDAEHVVTN